ncbi:glycosyltransferase family 4 protein [Flavisolibacter sp. BT320]|nr:glycosyltransferase family 4 protein [Flavisolibacter longurius]
MKYRLLLFKRQVEDLLMLPLIFLGRMMARIKPLEKEYRIFFFFPFYHIGGAEKVHLNIAKAIGGNDCIIFFTRKSQNKLFYDEFASSGCVIKDISRYTDNKWLYFNNIIFRGILSGYCNGQKNKPVVFNGQCNFGYKISPWVAKNIPQIELIHSLCSFSYIRIPFLPFITRTVMISTIRIQEHLDLYRRYGIPQKLGEKICFIMNGIDLPPVKPSSQGQRDEITVLYVGRSTPEKRVHLVAQIAALVKQTTNKIHFTFLGEVKDAIPPAYHHCCTFLGNQSDPEVIDQVYRQASILILVSDTEGFPMVVMEAMARGLAIIATSVGEIPLHVNNGVNGFLITDYKNEKTVISESIRYILQLYEDQKLLHEISANNIDYAFTRFGMQRFVDDYAQLVNEVKQDDTAP